MKVFSTWARVAKANDEESLRKRTPDLVVDRVAVGCTQNEVLNGRKGKKPLLLAVEEDEMSIVHSAEDEYEFGVERVRVGLALVPPTPNNDDVLVCVMKRPGRKFSTVTLMGRGL
jgi:hypothetical protein